MRKLLFVIVLAAFVASASWVFWGMEKGTISLSSGLSGEYNEYAPLNGEYDIFNYSYDNPDVYLYYASLGVEQFDGPDSLRDEMKSVYDSHFLDVVRVEQCVNSGNPAKFVSARIVLSRKPLSNKDGRWANFVFVDATIVKPHSGQNLKVYGRVHSRYEVASQDGESESASLDSEVIDNTAYEARIDSAEPVVSKNEFSQIFEHFLMPTNKIPDHYYISQSPTWGREHFEIETRNGRLHQFRRIPDNISPDKFPGYWQKPGETPLIDRRYLELSEIAKKVEKICLQKK